MDSDDSWKKLDEAEWHMESVDGSRTFEFEEAGGHIALFYVWAADRGLVPDEPPHGLLGGDDAVFEDGSTAQEHYDEDYRAMLASIQNREADAMDRALREVGEGLFSTSFLPEAASFASECYDTYLGNYTSYLGIPEGEVVAANWERFDVIAPHLDALYEQHRAGGCV